GVPAGVHRGGHVVHRHVGGVGADPTVLVTDLAPHVAGPVVGGGAGGGVRGAEGPVPRAVVAVEGVGEPGRGVGVRGVGDTGERQVDVGTLIHRGGGVERGRGGHVGHVHAEGGLPGVPVLVGDLHRDGVGPVVVVGVGLRAQQALRARIERGVGAPVAPVHVHTPWRVVGPGVGEAPQGDAGRAALRGGLVRGGVDRRSHVVHRHGGGVLAGAVVLVDDPRPHQVGGGTVAIRASGGRGGPRAGVG